MDRAAIAAVRRVRRAFSCCLNGRAKTGRASPRSTGCSARYAAVRLARRLNGCARPVANGCLLLRRVQPVRSLSPTPDRPFSAPRGWLAFADNATIDDVCDGRRLRIGGRCRRRDAGDIAIRAGRCKKHECHHGPLCDSQPAHRSFLRFPARTIRAGVIFFRQD